MAFVDSMWQDRRTGSKLLAAKWFYRKRDLPPGVTPPRSVKLHPTSEVIFSHQLDTNPVDCLEGLCFVKPVGVRGAPPPSHDVHSLRTYNCRLQFEPATQSLVPLGTAELATLKEGFDKQLMGTDTAAAAAAGGDAEPTEPAPAVSGSPASASAAVVTPGKRRGRRASRRAAADSGIDSVDADDAANVVDAMNAMDAVAATAAADATKSADAAGAAIAGDAEDAADAAAANGSEAHAGRSLAAELEARNGHVEAAAAMEAPSMLENVAADTVAAPSLSWPSSEPARLIGGHGQYAGAAVVSAPALEGLAAVGEVGVLEDSELTAMALQPAMTPAVTLHDEAESNGDRASGQREAARSRRPTRASSLEQALDVAWDLAGRTPPPTSESLGDEAVLPHYLSALPIPIVPSTSPSSTPRLRSRGRRSASRTPAKRTPPAAEDNDASRPERKRRRVGPRSSSDPLLSMDATSSGTRVRVCECGCACRSAAHALPPRRFTGFARAARCPSRTSSSSAEVSPREATADARKRRLSVSMLQPQLRRAVSVGTRFQATIPPLPARPPAGPPPVEEHGGAATLLWRPTQLPPDVVRGYLKECAVLWASVLTSPGEARRRMVAGGAAELGAGAGVLAEAEAGAGAGAGSAAVTGTDDGAYLSERAMHAVRSWRGGAAREATMGTVTAPGRADAQPPWWPYHAQHWALRGQCSGERATPWLPDTLIELALHTLHTCEYNVSAAANVFGEAVARRVASPVTPQSTRWECDALCAAVTLCVHHRRRLLALPIPSLAPCLHRRRLGKDLPRVAQTLSKPLPATVQLYYLVRGSLGRSGVTSGVCKTCQSSTRRTLQFCAASGCQTVACRRCIAHSRRHHAARASRFLWVCSGCCHQLLPGLAASVLEDGAASAQPARGQRPGGQEGHDAAPQQALGAQERAPSELGIAVGENGTMRSARIRMQQRLAWTCSFCTFVNAGTTDCQACGIPRYARPVPALMPALELGAANGAPRIKRTAQAGASARSQRGGRPRSSAAVADEEVGAASVQLVPAVPAPAALATLPREPARAHRASWRVGEVDRAPIVVQWPKVQPVELAKDLLGRCVAAWAQPACDCCSRSRFVAGASKSSAWPTAAMATRRCCAYCWTIGHANCRCKKPGSGCCPSWRRCQTLPLRWQPSSLCLAR